VSRGVLHMKLDLKSTELAFVQLDVPTARNGTSGVEIKKKTNFVHFVDLFHVFCHSSGIIYI
jgi:hypothetical protein